MDLLSLDIRVMLSQKVLDLRLLECCLGIKELGNSCQKLIEGIDEGGLCWDRNSGEAVLEVREDIGSGCLLYTSPSPRDLSTSRMPSSA